MAVRDCTFIVSLIRGQEIRRILLFRRKKQKEKLFFLLCSYSPVQDRRLASPKQPD